MIGTDDKISGVIDWGDLAVGDPAVDFTGVGYCFGLDALKTAIQESKRADPDRLLKRAVLSLAFAALSDVWYGEQQHEEARIEFAMRAFEDLIRRSNG